MTDKELIDLIPCDEKGAIICEKIDNYYKNNDVIGCIQYLVQEIKCDENTAMHLYLILTDQEETECDLTPQQIAHNNEVAREWQNKPKCPTCNSQNLKKISTTSKAVNTIAFGIFGTKRNKTFHCNNCGYEW